MVWVNVRSQDVPALRKWIIELSWADDTKKKNLNLS